MVMTVDTSKSHVMTLTAWEVDGVVRVYVTIFDGTTIMGHSGYALAVSSVMDSVAQLLHDIAPHPDEHVAGLAYTAEAHIGSICKCACVDECVAWFLLIAQSL
jgi:hypothetical protein